MQPELVANSGKLGKHGAEAVSRRGVCGRCASLREVSGGSKNASASGEFTKRLGTQDGRCLKKLDNLNTSHVNCGNESRSQFENFPLK